MAEIDPDAWGYGYDEEQEEIQRQNLAKHGFVHNDQNALDAAARRKLTASVQAARDRQQQRFATFCMIMDPKLTQDSVESFSKETLAEKLPPYILSLRQKNGEEFKRSSLIKEIKSLLAVYQQRLKEKISIADPLFVEAYNTLDNRARDLTRQGKGETDHHEGFTAEETARFRNNPLCDPNNPAGLNNQLHYVVTFHFGLRGQELDQHGKWVNLDLRNEDGTMLNELGDLLPGTEIDEKSFWVYQPKVSKMQTGSLAQRPPAQKSPKLSYVSSDSTSDFMLLYKLFQATQHIRATARVKGTLDQVKIFSRAATKFNKNDLSTWFIGQNVGRSKLADNWRTVCKAAKIDEKKTPHGQRAAVVTRGAQLGIDEQMCSLITGHAKGSKALKNIYQKPSINQEINLSRALQGVPLLPSGGRESADTETQYPVLQTPECISTSRSALIAPANAPTPQQPRLQDNPSRTNVNYAGNITYHGPVTIINVAGDYQAPRHVIPPARTEEVNTDYLLDNDDNATYQAS